MNLRILAAKPRSRSVAVVLATAAVVATTAGSSVAAVVATGQLAPAHVADVTSQPSSTLPAPTNLVGTTIAFADFPDLFFQWHMPDGVPQPAIVELYIGNATTPFVSSATHSPATSPYAAFDRYRNTATLIEFPMPVGTYDITLRYRDDAGRVSAPSNPVTFTGLRYP